MAGRFYGSTGLLLEDVSLDGDEIGVCLDSDASGRFIGPGGRVLGKAQGRQFSCRGSGEETSGLKRKDPPAGFFCSRSSGDGVSRSNWPRIAVCCQELTTFAMPRHAHRKSQIGHRKVLPFMISARGV